MALRCLLFCSDEGTAQPVCQILADLGIEAEHCPAAQAVERVTTQVLHLLIVDWDNQPEAAFLLNSARERKAGERPLALAIVGNDASVPQALQAGANSILRKPIQVNQTRDTLTTARGFLLSKQGGPAPSTQAAAAAASGGSDVVVERTLRAGEFLQSGATPGTHLLTESEVPKSFHQVAGTEIDPLKDLEPMAASVETQDVAPQSPPPEDGEPRGLSWYLKARPAPAPPAPAEPAPAKAELLRFSETPSRNKTSEDAVAPDARLAETGPAKTSEPEQRAEAALFAYISGESSEPAEPKPRRRFGKLATAGVLATVLVIAYVAVPQSVWRPKALSLLARAARAGHSWLNPQPVTTPPAPTSHENFGRAGDEYKLPVAETIPDATTDPSQIRVVPMIDPTAKQPNGANGAAGQTAVPVNTEAKDVPDQAQPDAVPVEENQSPSTQSSPAPQPETSNSGSTGQGSATQGSAGQTPRGQPEGGAVQPPAQVPAQVPVETTAPPVTLAAPAPTIHQRTSQPRSTPTTTSNSIPTSLKSQMGSMTPEASGNKPVEAALPSIEPVDLPEAAVRSLALQQLDPVYPESAKGRQGTVVLQLLIGRDGSVRDAKFLQGSLAFARAATDAARQWRFKPYTMNTHPVSVRTVLTLSFKPAS
jgi:TonB family protein